MPAQTPAITRSSSARREAGERHAGSSYGALDRDRAQRRRDRRARARGRRCSTTVALDVAAVATDAVGEVDLADLDGSVHLQADALGDDHAQVADVDAGVDVRLADRELERTEIEVERADPELVLALQVLRRS